MAEYDFDGPIARGAKGRRARLVQEWLALQGVHVAIDSSYGPATAAAVAEFQTARGIPASGAVDQETFGALVAPMTAALRPIAGPAGFGERIVACARQHLAQSPREVGGQNRGPWVRLYMKGHEGPDWPWCAGFVSCILAQAAESLGGAPPVPWTASCDLLAASARAAHRFIAEGSPGAAELDPGMIFLSRRRLGDWEHTGIVIEPGATTFRTIEGNTNDAGDREGYEVCRRIRGYVAKDFVRVGA